MEHFVCGYCPDEARATTSVRSLLASHFDVEEICVIARSAGEPEEAQIEELPIALRTSTARDAVAGLLVGAAAGIGIAATGWFGAVTAAVMLTGGLSGAAVGGLAGILAGISDWREKVDFAAEHFEPEGFLVGARTVTKVEEAQKALLDGGAVGVRFGTKDEALGWLASGHPVASVEWQDREVAQPPPWKSPKPTKT